MIYLFILEAFLLFFILNFVAFTIYHFFKTYNGAYVLKTWRNDGVSFKQSSIWYNLIVLFPKLVARQFSEYNPNDFKDSGLILFSGSQGSGKTMAMTHFCNMLKAKYPDLLIYTNYGLMFEDSDLKDWRTIVGELNGHSGLVACFDEISLWFSCRAYKDFPPDFLRTIVQNRKEHRLILGTCQQINMVDKQIRRQCTEIRKCRTFLGFVTIVWRFSPVFSGDGEIIKMLPLGIYAFLQNDDLRYMYDTFRVVENLKNIGFDEVKTCEK